MPKIIKQGNSYNLKGDILDAKTYFLTDESDGIALLLYNFNLQYLLFNLALPAINSHQTHSFTVIYCHFFEANILSDSFAFDIRVIGGACTPMVKPFNNNSMGIFSKGILGGFSGKVGSIIASRWRGINVMRSLPALVDHEPSPKQLEQRIKFRLTMRFLTPIRLLLKMGLQDKHLQGMTSFNRAVGELLGQAFSGSGTNLTLNHKLLTLSRGSLLVLQNLNLTVQPANPNQVILNWENYGSVMPVDDNDILNILVYHPGDHYYLIIQEGNRKDKSKTIDLPKNILGKDVIIWVFLSNSAAETSNSQVLSLIKPT